MTAEKEQASERPGTVPQAPASPLRPTASLPSSLLGRPSFPTLLDSARKTSSLVLATLSGLTEIESIPRETRYSAKSG